MNKHIKKLVYSAVFLALCMVLPFLTGQIPEIGQALSPMHIPVLLCGFACGWPWGLAVGFIAPILRSLIFQMPAMWPNAVAMAFELATYGFCSGILFKVLPSKIRLMNAAAVSAFLMTVGLAVTAYGFYLNGSAAYALAKETLAPTEGFAPAADPGKNWVIFGVIAAGLGLFGWCLVKMRAVLGAKKNGGAEILEFTGTARVLPVLIVSMILGRCVWGLARFVIAGFNATAFPASAFLAGAVLNAIPGIILHIILIPVLVAAMQKAKLILND